jgi:hypothetical protein
MVQHSFPPQTSFLRFNPMIKGGIKSMRIALTGIVFLLVTALTPLSGLAAQVNINVGIPVPPVPVPVVPVPVAPVPVAPQPAPQGEAYSAEAPPPLDFAQPPDMAVVPSGQASVYVVPNTFGVYFFNNSWFRFYNGFWFQAAAYNELWTPIAVGVVPEVILGVPPEYPMVLPPDYYRIRYGEFRQHWREWDRGHYWQRQEWFRREMRSDIRRERLNHIERERERWGREGGHRPPGFVARRPGERGNFPKPEHRPGMEPGHRPGMEPGRRPGMEPGRRPGVEPGQRPGVQPGQRPGVQPKPQATPKPKAVQPKPQAPHQQPHGSEGQHHGEPK